MKRPSLRGLLIIAVLILAFSVLTASLSRQEPSREQILTQLVINSLLTWHYAPPGDTNRWSEQAFDQYLKTLDYYKRFFTQEDLQTLASYRRKLDDEIRAGSREFFDLSWKLLSDRIREVQEYTDNLLAKPLAFQEDEYLETDPEKRDYPKDGQALKELWRKLVKAQTLNAYLDLALAGMDEGETEEKLTALAGKPFQPKLEEEARAKVRKDLNRVFRRLLNEKEEDRYARYLNAFATSLDPHTNYLAPDDKEDLEIKLSGKLEGIGATLQEDGDYIKVVEIIPGGPSWRQGKLKVGDLILKVTQGDGGEPVDLTNMPVDEAVRYIRGKKGTEVTLTVKKPDGQIEEITIQRDVVIIEETYAKSAVVSTGKEGTKVGYISLPSFYRDYSSADGRSSVKDVRAELEKLKKEKVEGIILDLRNNGGGILEEAVEMAGLFIGDGPIVQVKGEKGKINVYKDPDPGVVYDGPVVVLINSFSASASEILAAALQDYGRALIVGSPHSFGKGTVQKMFTLDYFLDYLYPRYTAYKPLGSLTVTEEKFYRINGGSTQLKGVAADLVLPDLYADLEIGEKYYDYALPWDEIKPLSYRKWTGSGWNLAALQENSARRVAANPYFAAVGKSMALVRKQQEATLQPLQWAKFLAERQQLAMEAKEIDATMNWTSKLHFEAVDGVEHDDTLAESQKEWLDQLDADLYLEEAYWIIGDLLAQQAMADAA